MCTPQSLNLKGFAGTRDPTFGAPGRGAPKLPFRHSASRRFIISMAVARCARAEGIPVLAAGAARVRHGDDEVT